MNTPLAEAKDAISKINATTHWSYIAGPYIVLTLLQDCKEAELTPRELRLLSRGYNWWGKHPEAFDASFTAFRQEQSQWQTSIGDLARDLENAFHENISLLLAKYDEMIEGEWGHPAWWHLRKADFFLEVATGELELEDYEWHSGDRLLHPEAISDAVREIQAAMKKEPALIKRYTVEGWGCDWKERFKALLETPEYQQLLTLG